MNSGIANPAGGEVNALLRGDVGAMSRWLEQTDTRRLVQYVAIIFAGAGCYGAAMGWWRDPLQGFYVAIKLPLILLLTTLGNALLNAMLAPLLGLNFSFRQSLMAILMSFTISASILGAFSPLAAFLVWNAPPLSDARASAGTYSFIMVTHVAVIAFAGIVANLRLLQMLRERSGNLRVARRVLFAWLAGNLFLGTQLSWIFRPFIGSPGLPVQFLRDHPLNGNFYEAIWRSLLHLLNAH